MADNTNEGSLFDALVMQSALSPVEKDLRDKFVTQYLVDYDAWAATIRCGFLRSVAVEYAGQLMQDPYVQRELARKQLEESADPKATAKLKKRQTEAALLREAHYKGVGSSHAARVSALAKLCNIYDMDGATKITANVVHRGGVMLVPAIASVDEWEKAAASSQDKLIQDARH